MSRIREGKDIPGLCHWRSHDIALASLLKGGFCCTDIFEARVDWAVTLGDWRGNVMRGDILRIWQTSAFTKALSGDFLLRLFNCRSGQEHRSANEKAMRYWGRCCNNRSLVDD